jgi:glycosyltransferase involved in cell wall biosynthesis
VGAGPLDASIVIPTRNRSALLARTLERLRRQTHPRERYEIVVADDGSQDETPTLLGREESRGVIRQVRHEHRRGAAAARNSGIRLSRGRVVVLLDDDILVLPDFVVKHLSHHEEGGRRVVLGNTLTYPEAGYSSLSRYIDSRGVHKLRPGEPPPFRYFTAANSSVPRELLLEAGLFDERLSEYGGEDLELGYRLGKVGAEFLYDSTIRVGHFKRFSVSQLCRDLETMGRRSLPVLVNLHPELGGLFGLGPAAAGVGMQGRIRRAMQNLLLGSLGSSPLYSLIKAWGLAAERLWLPSFVLDYLVFFSRRRGYRRSFRRSA